MVIVDRVAKKLIDSECQLDNEKLLATKYTQRTSSRTPGDVEGESVAKKTRLVHKSII